MDGLEPTTLHVTGLCSKRAFMRVCGQVAFQKNGRAVQVFESAACAALEIAPHFRKRISGNPRESHRALGSPRVERQFKTGAAYRVRRRN